MHLIESFKRSTQLVKNTSWLLSSEILAKFSRILVIFTLAASLSAVDYGVVMLTLACHEVFKLAMRSGAGSQIIQCSEENLAEYVKNGAVLQWVLGVLLFLLQSVTAVLLGKFYQNPDLVTLLVGMAVVYLLYPLVSTKVFLIQRANQMRYFSLRNGACITAENVSIAIFAYYDQGILSVVYGKWVFAILWMALFIKSPVKRFGVGFKPNTMFVLLRTSSQLLCTEFVRAFRSQADMFIGAKLLNPELFGIYSFAKTAGVNLGQSLSTAFNAAIYPFLCAKNRSSNNANTSYLVYMLSACVGAMFVLQALLVPLYVPLFFTQDWQQNYFVISLLCLANVPLIFVDTRCNSLRSRAQFGHEFFVRLYCLVLASTTMLVWAPKSPEALAQCIAFISIFSMVILLPMMKRQFSRYIPFPNRSSQYE